MAQAMGVFVIYLNEPEPKVKGEFRYIHTGTLNETEPKAKGE